MLRVSPLERTLSPRRFIKMPGRTHLAYK